MQTLGIIICTHKVGLKIMKLWLRCCRRRQSQVWTISIHMVFFLYSGCVNDLIYASKWSERANALNGLELYYNCIETKETATMYTYKNHREKIFEMSTMSTTLRKLWTDLVLRMRAPKRFRFSVDLTIQCMYFVCSFDWTGSIIFNANIGNE